jgi:hypothetical protein
MSAPPPSPQAGSVNNRHDKGGPMLRLLGLNPYLRTLIGIGLVVFAIATHRPLLIAVGAAVGVWSLVNVVVDLLNRDRNR